MTQAVGASREDETQLLDQLRSGDDAAYESLVRTHSGRLLAVARRLLRNDEDAADAVQEGFLQAFRKLDSFKGDSKVGTWLHRIVVNAALMKLRRQKSRPSKSIEELLPQFNDKGHRVIPEDEAQQTSLDLAQQKETRHIVREAIDQLPDDYRTVVLLRDVEQMDTRETADQLGVSTAVVKTRLHRARQALRGLLTSRIQRGDV